MQSKAQSSMEYLTIYGMAIITIGIVLAALFTLGLFNSSSISSSSCTASVGYLCSAPLLTTSGTLNVIIGQQTGSNEYNIGIACTSLTSSSGPNPSTAMMYIAADGSLSASLPATPLALYIYNVQSVSIGDLPCYGTTGLQLGNIGLGFQYTGTLWITYTTSSDAPGVNNPYRTTKLASLSLKSV